MDTADKCNALRRIFTKCYDIDYNKAYVVYFFGGGRFEKGYYVRFIIDGEYTDWINIGLEYEEAKNWALNNGYIYDRLINPDKIPWYELTLKCGEELGEIKWDIETI